MLLGHGHPAMREAACEQLPKGMIFFANNTAAVEFAEDILCATPCGEQLRYVSSGGEADMYAIRAVRAFPRRNKIVKFEGGDRSMSAEAQMSLALWRRMNFPLAVPDSAGIPASVAAETLIAPFNDFDYIRGLFIGRTRRSGGCGRPVLTRTRGHAVWATPSGPRRLGRAVWAAPSGPRRLGRAVWAAPSGPRRKSVLAARLAGRLQCGSQNLHIANLIGKDQDQARIHYRALIFGQAIMYLYQTRIKTVGVRDVRRKVQRHWSLLAAGASQGGTQRV
jgi:hypothetical protein